MKIFTKIEFSNYIDFDPISIGMVSENGKQKLYIEVQDFERTKCSDFTRNTVIKLLGKECDAMIDQANLASKMGSWINSLPEKVQILYDGPQTYRALEKMFKGEWPVNVVAVLNIRPLIDSSLFDFAVMDYYSSGMPWFHALHGAMASRAGWHAVFWRRNN